MKKTLLLFFFCLAAFVVKAGIETTDQISISEITVAPGGDAVYFDVSLQGSDVLYSAYEVTLQLPEGLTVEYTGTTPKPITVSIITALSSGILAAAKAVAVTG